VITYLLFCHFARQQRRIVPQGPQQAENGTLSAGLAEVVAPGRFRR